MNPQEPRKVTITIPASTEPKWSNTAQVTVLDDAVVIQFAYVRPNSNTGQLLSEIILSPKHAIDFQRALDSTIKKHFTRHLDKNIPDNDA